MLGLFPPDSVTTTGAGATVVDAAAAGVAAAVCERVLRAGEPLVAGFAAPAEAVAAEVVEAAAADVEAAEALLVGTVAALAEDAAAAVPDEPWLGPAAEAAGGSDMLKAAFSHTALAGGWAPNVRTALGQVQQVQQDSGGEKAASWASSH